MPGDYYFETGFRLSCPALRVFDPSTGSGALVHPARALEVG